MRKPAPRTSRSPRPLQAILIASNSGMAFAAARCMRLEGVRFHAVCTGRYWSVRSMGGCSGATVIDPAQLEGEGTQVVALLRSLLREHPDAVIVPSGMVATLFLARVAKDLPAASVFPLSPEPMLVELHDKWRFAALLGRLGLPHPVTSLVTTIADLDTVSVKDAVVVKPLGAEGSQGVEVVRSDAALAAVVRRVDASGLLPLLLQEFIPGDDLGISVVADHGEVRAHRVQQFHDGGSLYFIDRPDALGIARELVAATGAHGVLNIDLRRDGRDDSIVVIECNPRLYATSHKSAYAGMNPVVLGMLLARGEWDGDVESSDVPTHVESPLAVMADYLRGRRRSLTDATRLAVRAEATNPVSSLLRAAEWRFPELARSLRGERATHWEAYAEQDGA